MSAVAEAGKLIDESVAAARSMGALPAEAFALTKHQIRDPVLKWVREEGARFDTAALELWAAPKTLAAIREYAARTFKKTGD